MKKTIIKFVLFAACSTAIQAKVQWMEDATTIWTKKTNQNVGIGLSNPTAKIDIYNSTNLNTAAGSVTDIAGFAGLTNSKSALKVQLYRHSDGLDWLSASTRLQAATDGVHQAYLEFNPKGAPAGLALGTASGNAITVNDNGNVGIGTTAPNAKLHIPNGEAIIGGDASLSPTKLNSTLHVESKDDKSSTYPFYVGLNSGSDLFWVRGNGNGYFRSSLGIGTAEPNAKLHIPNGEAIIGGDASLTPTKLNSTLHVESKDDKSSTYPFYVGLKNGTDLLWVRGDGSGYFKGNVGIGTSDVSTHKLSVNGSIRAKEIVVETGFADFVFDDNYKLRSLKEVEQFVKSNKHLPEIPSQKEVEKNGVPLGDISSKLLMKIEELTLYIIQQQKEIEKQKAINNILISKIEKLETKQ